MSIAGSSFDGFTSAKKYSILHLNTSTCNHPDEWQPKQIQLERSSSTGWRNSSPKPEHGDDLMSPAVVHKAIVIKDLLQLSLPPIHVAFLHTERLIIGPELSIRLSHEHWTPQMPSQTRLEFETPGNIFVIKPPSSRKTESKKGEYYGGLKWGAASF